MKKSKILIVLLAVIMCFAVLGACANDGGSGSLTCNITVTAADVLENKTLISEDKLPLVPEDGVIFKGEVSFDEGANLFDVLTKTLEAEKIHYEAQDGSYFIAFGNIYASDCEYGGWLYKVNGKEPSIGANEYKLSAGDNVEFFYVCDYNAYFTA